MRNVDRHLGLLVSVASNGAGVAMMATPLYFPQLPAALFFWGGVLVFVMGSAAALALLIGERRSVELRDRRPMTGPVLLMVLGAIAFGTGAVWYYMRLPHLPPAAPSEQGTPQGQGGEGGGAKVGGDGLASGGPGGHAGRYGKGGGGGAAEVGGSGIAAGGAGGAAGEDGVWRPPAKSGFENLMRQAGLPVDPYLRQFGRGAAVPGYEDKLQVVERLRADYFRGVGARPQTAFEDIAAVPLDYLNAKLAAQDEAWRVRIVDDEYEFYIPPVKGL